MSLTSMQIESLCSIAKKAALAAGKIITESLETPIEVKTKEAGDSLASQVVTKVDIAAQKAILSFLTPTLRQYKLGLLTEESSDNKSRFENDYFWCVDPLDGTLLFSQNKNGYSTSIALVTKTGVPIIGVVYDSRNKNLYHAIKDRGAFKNDTALKVNQNSVNLNLFCDHSYLEHPQYQKHIETITADLKVMDLAKLIVHPPAGAVMNAINTIESAPAMYYKLPKKKNGGGSLWDFAATSIIQSEAGGYNSDFFKDPIELNREESTFLNHKGILFLSSQSLLSTISHLS